MAKKAQKSTARKVSKNPTRNLLFGVVGDHPFSREVGKLIDHQLHYANIYQTALVELELERRQRERDHMKTLDPALFEITEKIDRFNEEINLEYTKLHSIPRRNCTRNPNAEAFRVDTTERIKTLKDQRRPLYDKQRERQEEVTKRHFLEGDRTEKEIKDEVEAENVEALGCKPGPNSEARRQMNAAYNQRIRQCPDLKKEWLDRYEIRQDIERKRKIIVEKMHNGELFAEAITKNEAEAEKHGYEPPDRTLYSGNYLGVDEAFKAAKKTAGIHPQHFDGEGKIGIQVPKKNKADRTWSDLCAGMVPNVRVTKRVYLGNDMTRTQQRRPGEDIKSKYITGTKTRRETLTFSLKVAETRTKNGVTLIHKDRWIDIPVVVHRPIPPDAAVKWIWLLVKKVNNRVTYSLMVSLEHKSFGDSRLEAKHESTLAVVLGWKTRKDGSVRIATTYDGNTIGEVLLHASTGPENRRGIRLYRQWDENIKGLFKVADTCFDVTKGRFEDWLESHPVDNLTDPFDRDLSLSTINHWKSHRKLHRLTFAMLRRYNTNIDVESLWKAWKVECGVPFAGSPGVANPQDLFLWKNENHLDTMLNWFEAHGVSNEMARMSLYLEWWRRKDNHLVTWGRLEQKRMKLSIREVYRCKALELAKQYSTIVLLNWDKAKAAKKPTLENDTRTQQEVEAAAIRQFAGPSGFALALKGASGDAFQTIDVKYISSSCCHCGGEPLPVTQDDGYRQCTSCKKTYRKNENYAVNLWNAATQNITKAAE